ncbi:MAG TPA: lipoyl(octanoyl) transferase LipB [Thermoplasmata archaeon]|nr:lipoyl(octanoyl) transferase LipB [Thermoplasmata archaeon]
MPASVDWGLREYTDALAEMRRMRAQRRRGEIPDTLILVEHPPVITVGVQGGDGEMLPPGIAVVSVERGGKSTYHGPGQLVAYPIVDLDRRGRDVRRFVHETEELVVRTLATVGLTAGRVTGRRGVWVDGERKIASVGIAVEEWVTFHGLALNVTNDLAPFAAFHPCGFDGRVMTSVERELARPISVAALKPPLVRAFGELFAPGAPPIGPIAAPPMPVSGAAG